LAATLLKNPQSVQVTPRNTTVQRLTQVIHPVGRGKKKALLAHIIQEHNWSQVLVFTRTKFGANNVAEFLTKNGIQAMALHGNKSQGARTQALSGFKSGEIRALVATDIAARGIDIDELPHVVNYEIPNVSEDYVHRIGRTGRAGNDGAAVSLVCLDEEGFMRDIERFTKQTIEVKVIEGFGPEQGEQAEPIAMGRQTIWGGIGKPPSREVMAAAAKAARTEMMTRIRDNKDANGKSGNGGRAGADRTSRAPQPQGQRSAGGNGNGNGGRNAGNGNGGRNGNGNGNGARQGARPAQPRPAQNHAPRQDNELQPRDGAHNSQSPFVQRDATPRNTDGQPDPLRTSVDSMGGRGRRGGGNGGGGRPNRSGGGGYGARGPGNPARTFGR
ncbi:MAG: helicase, partial [Ramlibacter sp.]|nr:helicase [Ramlibacter sp.]